MSYKTMDKAIEVEEPADLKLSLSQIENILEERKAADRRAKNQPTNIERERRQKQRRGR